MKNKNYYFYCLEGFWVYQQNRKVLTEIININENLLDLVMNLW
jgi:hypothetical protein